ncbi:DNA replication complex GINS protein SLD5 [Folsomia candida]|uniref:DNA replication complex GINS protein SLD5 n=1 Tax=Folsomia candida TaxID=158441 RepID=UPI000B8F2E20|nr:DNA replication complex GINS protein SLD5 [Folsomia candida]
MDISLNGGDDQGGPVDNEEDDDDDEPIVVTSAEVLQRLEHGWMNEKMSPELLPPLEQEKDAMLGQIKVMERNVTTLDKRDVRTDIHKLELERIKFVVVSYMRTRFFKVQRMSFTLYEAEMKRSRNQESILFKEEFTFLKNLVTRTADYFKATLISKMPPVLQKFEIKKFRVLPQFDAFVFFRVLQNQTVQVEVNDEILTIELEEGDLHFMRYEPIAHLLAGGAIHLV